MIEDIIQIKNNLTPNQVMLVIDKNKITYSDFNKQVEKIQGAIQSMGSEYKNNIVVLKFKNPFLLLCSVIACNRENKKPAIIPPDVPDFELKLYLELIESEIVFDDNSCMMQFNFKESKNYLYRETDTQVILFTSGTEGFPKAVELSFLSIKESALNWNRIVDFYADDRYLNILPLNHIAGISIFFRSLYCGFISTLNQYKKDSFLYFQNISCVSLVPKMLVEMLQNQQILSYLKKMKLIFIGGDSINEETFNILKENKLNAYIGYGMTETASSIAGYWVADISNFMKGYIGEAHRNVNISIVNNRICIKSNTIINKYINDSNAVNTFISNDLGENINGKLFLKSRASNVIVSGGENVSLKYIEKILSLKIKHKDLVVLGIKDDLWGEVPIVFYLDQDKTLTCKGLYQFCKRNLSKHMVPKHFIRINKIPLKNKQINYNVLKKIAKEKNQ